MKYSVKINAPLSTVFQTIATASEREQWTRDVISVTYNDPANEQIEGAMFQQKQKEGKMTNTYEGKNLQVTEPSLFSYQLMNKAFTMTISYHLTDQGEMTYVEQHYETEYHSGFAKFMGKLFQGMTNKIAKDILDGLKMYVEKEE
ncbi:SRPBCC family protein [Pontibacillus marinus]|uniref:Polyketide cyclase n=1 Tax=Pontibacillus marinus BH030004 = DSM 16465 TaxID=1385511 RepID=A0A0A5G8X5_9BACI|nr:SRPBCC family protein [Pontibacillus marinus]KGX89596.1 hypothetical protein N783_05645 [Pontibacillus marinus BH030004 = DSM 16465]